jgi:hypothetical protein
MTWCLPKINKETTPQLASNNYAHIWYLQCSVCTISVPHVPVSPIALRGPLIHVPPLHLQPRLANQLRQPFHVLHLPKAHKIPLEISHQKSYEANRAANNAFRHEEMHVALGLPARVHLLVILPHDDLHEFLTFQLCSPWQHACHSLGLEFEIPEDNCVIFLHWENVKLVFHCIDRKNSLTSPRQGQNIRPLKTRPLKIRLLPTAPRQNLQQTPPTKA